MASPFLLSLRPLPAGPAGAGRRPGQSAYADEETDSAQGDGADEGLVLVVGAATRPRRGNGRVAEFSYCCSPEDSWNDITSFSSVRDARLNRKKSLNPRDSRI